MKTRACASALVMAVIAACSGAEQGETEDGAAGTQGDPAPDRDPDKFGYCPTAFNGACNEPVVGDGTCEAGSDYYDCGSCPPEWRGDGYCDDPTYCPPGTDPQDCGGASGCAAASNIPADKAQIIGAACNRLVECGIDSCDACTTTLVDAYHQSPQPDTWGSVVACAAYLSCSDLAAQDYSACDGGSSSSGGDACAQAGGSGAPGFCPASCTSSGTDAGSCNSYPFVECNSLYGWCEHDSIANCFVCAR